MIKETPVTLNIAILDSVRFVMLCFLGYYVDLAVVADFTPRLGPIILKPRAGHSALDQAHLHST